MQRLQWGPKRRKRCLLAIQKSEHNLKKYYDTRRELEEENMCKTVKKQAVPQSEILQGQQMQNEEVTYSAALNETGTMSDVRQTSMRQNVSVQQNEELIQRMGSIFSQTNVRKVMPDAEVVQTAGKSDYKIKKEKSKIARGKNSVADDVSYDLIQEANSQLTAVNPELRKYIENNPVDMTKEENIYHCAVIESFIAESGSLMVGNFLSEDNNIRYPAFHQMVESILSIKIPEEELTTEYVLSHLQEFQRIQMRVSAFSSFWNRSKSDSGDAIEKDSQLFAALDQDEIAVLEDKIRIGQKLGNILQCALMQKGLRYVKDPDSPLNDASNGTRYAGLYQTMRLDYSRREDADRFRRQAKEQAEIEKTQLQEISAHCESVYATYRESLPQKVEEKTRNAPVPESVRNSLSNTDKVDKVREIFERADIKEFFRSGVEASNADFKQRANKNTARTALGLRARNDQLRNIMNPAFSELNPSLRKYFNSINLDCADLLPMMREIKNFPVQTAYFGPGTENISNNFLEIFKSYLLSPAGIEYCRNMYDQMSGADIFREDNNPNGEAIMQSIFSDFVNTYFSHTFESYSGTVHRVALETLRIMYASINYMHGDLTPPDDAPAFVSNIIDGYRETARDILSRIGTAG